MENLNFIDRDVLNEAIDYISGILSLIASRQAAVIQQSDRVSFIVFCNRSDTWTRYFKFRQLEPIITAYRFKI